MMTLVLGQLVTLWKCLAHRKYLALIQIQARQVSANPPPKERHIQQNGDAHSTIMRRFELELKDRLGVLHFNSVMRSLLQKYYSVLT